ncbi:Sak single strand annealing protein [Staphylococcus hominis]|uniref:Sak single strand annealing protein n=1 Tax=Staphylococcus hominis TaxID=1290 RepID=UPI003515D3B2
MSEKLNFADKFRELNSRDVSAHVEKKQNLNYLSWAYVQQELTKEDPNYSERVIEFPYPDSTNENFFVPYLKTNEGYMVCVELTVFGVTKREWLPVLDYRNKPVAIGSSTAIFDINKAIKRCMVKCAAKFGLGNYLYLGEEAPDVSDELKELLDKEAKEFIKIAEQSDKGSQFEGQIKKLKNMNVDTLNKQDIEKTRNLINTWLGEIK